MYEYVPHVRRTMTIGSCKQCPHYSEFEKNKNIYSVCMAQHKVSVGYRDAEAWFEECPIWETSDSRVETDWKSTKEFKPEFNTLYLVRVVNENGNLLGYTTGWPVPSEKKWEVRMNFALPVNYHVSHFAEVTYVAGD